MVVSLLTQERLVGLSLGLVAGYAAHWYQQRTLWQLTAGTAEAISNRKLPPPPPPATAPLFSEDARQTLARQWNQAVDASLGALVSALSTRGW